MKFINCHEREIGEDRQKAQKEIPLYTLPHSRTPVYHHFFGCPLIPLFIRSQSVPWHRPEYHGQGCDECGDQHANPDGAAK